MYYSLTTTEGRRSLVIYGDGISTVVPGSHAHFDELAGYLSLNAAHDPRHVRTLLDTGGTLAAELRQLSERVTYNGESLRFDGDPIDTALSRHIIRMIRDGDHDYQRWVRFLENLALNPSKKSRQHLFTWLAGRDFTITPDGRLLAYKGVQADAFNSSVRTGTAAVNGTVHHGHIPNPVGAVITMPRSQVSGDRREGCAAGLHAGTYEYARTFGQRLLLVSINPRDVVSVPRDCQFQKVRCCRYTVLNVQDRPAPVTVPSYGGDDEADW